MPDQQLESETAFPFLKNITLLATTGVETPHCDQKIQNRDPVAMH